MKRGSYIVTLPLRPSFDRDGTGRPVVFGQLESGQLAGSPAARPWLTPNSRLPGRPPVEAYCPTNQPLRPTTVGHAPLSAPGPRYAAGDTPKIFKNPSRLFPQERPLREEYPDRRRSRQSRGDDGARPYSVSGTPSPGQ